MQTIQKYYRVDRREICFLRFIFEAYDGIAILTTIDPVLGLVVLQISSGCEEYVEMILQDLKKEIMIEPVANFEKSREVL
ncbi:MAG: DUF4911 domain-containing protein [Desulfobacterales bacterium]|nr:DUF4911 domain-containing protein [Desulfobacterales bacterium]